MKPLNRILPLCCVIISMLALPALAGTYPMTGGEEGSHSVDGLGYFNALNAFNIEVTGARTISDPSFHPMVADLDGDGEPEIIVFNGNTMEIYRGLNLDVVEAVSMTGVGTSEIRATAYDLDGDGYTEIIARASDDATLVTIEYNGSHAYISTTFELFTSANDCVFRCAGVGECYAACTARSAPNAAGATQNHIYAVFDASGVTSTYSLTPKTYGAVWACPVHPSAPIIYVEDIDGDSLTEIVSAYAIFVESAPDYVDLVIEISEVLGNGTIVTQAREDETITGMTYTSGVTDACYLKGADRYLTAPGVGNLDGAIGDGLEIVVGMMDGVDSYVIREYSGIDLNLQETYNEGVVSAEGELLSNVMFMDAFPGSTSQDFCVVGFEKTEQEITALCGTNSPKFGYFDEQSFDMDMTSVMTWNVSQAAYSYTRMTTAANMLTSLEDGEDLDEIVTSFGILRFDYDIGSGEDLEVVYNSPIGRDAIIIPADADGSGLNDLIILTTSNLYYIDDGFSNTQAFINLLYSEIDPCTQLIWKLNTSVSVEIRADDIDTGDRVQARAILYYGTANVQDTGWSALTTSPTDFAFSFVANVSAVNAIGYFMVRDPDENNRSFPADLCADPTSDTGCHKIAFSVSPTGTGEFGGGCEESFGTDPDDIIGEVDEGEIEEGGECEDSEDCAGFPDFFCNSEGECEANIDETDNAVTQGVRDTARELNVPIIFFVLVLIGGVWYWVIISDMPGHGKPLIGLVGTLFITGGSVVLGLLNVIWVIIPMLGVIGYVAISIMQVTGGN